MPWTAQSGNTYKLCLLDTNAISEIIKNSEVEGYGFINRFSPSEYAPIELRRRKDLYDKFINFFSVYTFFLLKPFQFLLEDEINAYEKKEKRVTALLYAFTPLGRSDQYRLKDFMTKLFKKKEIKKLKKNWRNEEKITLNTWLSNKKNFTPKNSEANSRDAEYYIEEAGIQTLIKLYPSWVKENIIDKSKFIKLDELASFKVMLYSQYYRLYDPHWDPKPQEVTDVTIVSAVPYMDAIITEN